MSLLGVLGPPRSMTLAAAIVGVAMGACGEGDPSDRAIAEWSVEASPLLAIGQVEGDPEYLFEAVVAVRLIDDGGVAVADRGYGTIRLYDARGALVRELGGIGEGPGEFAYLLDLRYVPPDTLVAYDSELFRLTTLTTAGDLVSTVPVRGGTGAPELWLGRFPDGSHAFAWIVQGARDPNTVTVDRMAIGHADAHGVLTGSLAEGAGMRRFGNGPVPFSPYFWGLVLGDSAVFTDGLTELGIVASGGGDERRAPLPFEPPSLGDAIDALRPGLREAGSDFLSWLDDTPTSVEVPRVATALGDDRDRIWLKRYDPETDSWFLTFFRNTVGGRWAIRDLRGVDLGRIDLPPNLTLRDVRGDRIAGVERDELGVERVVVYRMHTDG